MIRPSFQPLTEPMDRIEFARRIHGIAGFGNARLVVTPRSGDTTTTIDLSPSGRIVTWDGDISSRLTRSGRGWFQSFNGTSQYGTMPDAPSMSFGNSLVDSPFSGVVLANITDTAAYRVMLAKYNFGAGNPEYAFQIRDTDDALMLLLADKSTGNTAVRASSAAITQGSPRTFHWSYDGGGGATAGNGIVLLQDGATIASTATNGASYVAMEDTSAAPSIGALADGLSFFAGSIGFAAVFAGYLSPAQHRQITVTANEFFGLSL